MFTRMHEDLFFICGKPYSDLDNLKIYYGCQVPDNNDKGCAIFSHYYGTRSKVENSYAYGILSFRHDSETHHEYNVKTASIQHLLTLNQWCFLTLNSRRFKAVCLLMIFS